MDRALDFKDSFCFPLGAKALTLFSAANRTIADPAIDFIKRVPPFAVRNSGIISLRVFNGCDRPKVSRVDAPLLVAKVVNNKAGRDISIDGPVRNSVRLPGGPAKAENTIPVLIRPLMPQPTAVFSHFKFRIKSRTLLRGHPILFGHTFHGSVFT